MLNGSTAEPVRDEKSVNGSFYIDEVADAGHHRDSVYGSLGAPFNLGQGGGQPRHRHHRRRHRHGHHKSKGSNEPTIAEGNEKEGMAPSERIQFLLDQPEDGDGALVHPVFTEMEELQGTGESANWKEVARWVKFEEDVEEGGNRWSKPHVATLSLHSLFELRNCLMNGTVILEMVADSLPQIFDIMLDKLIANHQLEWQFRDETHECLMRRKTHQYEHKHRDNQDKNTGGSFISTVRSIADIGKTFSSKNLERHDGDGVKARHRNKSVPALQKKFSVPDSHHMRVLAGHDGQDSAHGSHGNQLALPKVGSLAKLGSHHKGLERPDPSQVDLTKVPPEQRKMSSTGSHPSLFATASSATTSKDRYFSGTHKLTKHQSAIPLQPKHGVGSAGTVLDMLKAAVRIRNAKDKATTGDVAHVETPPSGPAEYKGNLHFFKKLPPGVEASNVLVGEVDFLSRHISCFVRLQNPVMLEGLTEVPVPTRFLFILLGPTGHALHYREIGRAIAVLMSDEIFHDVAYKARHVHDLLDGVDEFLDQVTVLPPGEWDPNIRIEPPTHIPSQEKRIKPVASEAKTIGGGDGGDGGDGGKEPGKDEEEEKKEEEEGGHGNDPALKRTGKWFGGMINDIKRKIPFYVSDFKDALNMQCVASTFFMYFALLAPIVTFGGLLEEATGQRMAAIENLVSGAVCGITYHIFAGQPLTIIGSTGPVLVFETIIYELCTTVGIQYLSFRLWINLWTALILIFMVATDASSLVSYITRFTEESFATLIAVIFIYEALKKCFKLKTLELHHSDFSGVTDIRNGTCYCQPKVSAEDEFDSFFPQHQAKKRWKVDFMKERPWIEMGPSGTNATGIDYTKLPLDLCDKFQGDLVGDSCYKMNDVFLMSMVLMLGTFFLAMTLKKSRSSPYFPTIVRQMMSDFAVFVSIVVMVAFDIYMGINTPKLNVPSELRPTHSGRGWLISPFDNPWWTIPLALLPALLACILIFMDQQITAVIVNRKENKLKKGCGYHLDLFVVAVQIAIVGFLGIPIYVAATVMSINHVNSLRVESESRAPGEVATFVGVREQRVTGIVTFALIGFSVLMTSVLKHIPMPVLYGVFLYMGISSLNGIQLFDRFLLLFMPMKYQPDYMFLRHVPIRHVHLFTAFQVACLAMLWVIKSIKQTSITFPIMLVIMVMIRKAMEYVFVPAYLQALDDTMPDFHLRKKEDAKKKKEQEQAEDESYEDEDEQKKKKKNKGDGGDHDESPKPMDIDERRSSLRPVQTEAHLHIPMASGNVMKIPLTTLDQKDDEKPINISEELKKSGTWKHIESASSIAQPGTDPKNGKDDSHKSYELAPDDEPITIKVQRASPSVSAQNVTSPPEAQPLLGETSVKKPESGDSPV